VIEYALVAEEDIPKAWEAAYGNKYDGKWRQFNGPYFKDPVPTLDEYLEGEAKGSVGNPQINLIKRDDDIIGALTWHWEDGPLQQWLECGIVLYNSADWGTGIGTAAMKYWIGHLFDMIPHIQRVGLTTWSGNIGMMKVSEKLGMTQEARIRKVRYWQNQYWDSIKYGILREEFTQD